ncbi:MAG: hypothetical protein Q9201_003359 [Fulgogasparrea decipioides]
MLEADKEPPRKHNREIQSLEHALEILRSQPQQEALLDVLEWMHPNNKNRSGFDIYSQSSKASQVIHALVNDVLPHHWSSICGSSFEKNLRMKVLITQILRNVGGISAITTRLKILLTWRDDSEDRSQVRTLPQAGPLDDVLSLFESVLEVDGSMLHVWEGLSASLSNTTRRWLAWKELVALLGDGRVLSIVSEADDVVAKASQAVRVRSWLSDGSKYSAWIGRNLAYVLENPQNSQVNDSNDWKVWVQMLERALTLGHIDVIIEAVYDRVISGASHLVATFLAFIMAMKGSTKRIVIHSLLRILAETTSSTQAQSGSGSRGIGGSAALLRTLSRDDKGVANVLVEWLSSDGLVQNLAIRRAVIAALAQPIDNLKTALSESLRTFGDKLCIKHAPILQQEGTTENLLLLTGYIHRVNPQNVAEMARSSLYLNSISNRLASSSARASLLGMFVGMAVSELVDPPDKRMNFSSAEVTGPQAQRFVHLTAVRDPLGSIEDLRHDSATSESTIDEARKLPPTKAIPLGDAGQALTRSKVVSIEEIDSASEPEDEDLPTYAKPDSDASDSDDDPTIVNRDKPTAPVYITGLLSGLRDTENYDRHTLALTHASSLIRRKAAFGTEVTDNIEELASVLTSLQDKWSFENFQELRLQAMIAVLVAQPLEAGQWFSRTYFSGDYSVSQRATVLTTLGLGARELAGFGGDNTTLTKVNQVSKNADLSFPSQQLPPKLHKIYAPEAPITSTSKQLENSILKPMALRAADALSGPNILKTRTFSSRMEVDEKRTKAIPNPLAKTVAHGFFFPLTGRFQIHLKSSGHNSVVTGTMLLPLYLRTLSLLLHAAGSSTLSLPLMTAEFLSLILALRSHSTASHLVVLDALLFAFLTVMEVNGDREGQRRLAQESGKEVLEMEEWIRGVFERVRGDGDEEERVRALAAGCLARVRDLVDSEERMLMGVGVGFL